MKAYKDTKPTKVHIDEIGNIAHVSLSTNVKEVEIEDKTQFEYDYYLIKVPLRDNLKQDILDNFELWVTRASELENKRQEPTLEERLEALEMMELERILND